jgi:hypothetical protein
VTNSDKKMNLIVNDSGRGRDIICSKEESKAAASVFAEVRNLLITGNIVSAIENFRERGVNADLGRLYAAYQWLQDEIINLGPDYTQQMNLFNTVFLSMIEERGEADSDIYISVLRDSSEYHFFNSLVGKSPVPEIGNYSSESEGKNEIPQDKKKAEKIITLNDILYSSDRKPALYSIESWEDLIRKHFEKFNDENTFVSESKKIIRRLTAIKEKEPFHLELAAVYTIEWLSVRSSLSLESKDFAMKLMDIMAESGSLWKRLHREYKLIIKKPSLKKRASR